jgi:hypothetical protein
MRKEKKMRRCLMEKNVLVVLMVVLASVLGFAVVASANTGALDDFNAQYPSNTFNNSCKICHTSGADLNPYGAALADAGGTGGSIAPEVFVAVEGLDSDGDGFTNIQEINAGTFPGNPNSHPSNITITAPNGGEVIPADSTFTVLYDASAGVASVKVKYSLDNGVTWLAADGTAGAGSFDWNVPTPVKNQKKALVKVIGYDAGNKKVGADKSDAPFTIEVLSVTAPVADEIVPKGTVYTVTWTTIATKSPVNSAKVFYTLGSSGIWKTADGTVGDPLGSFDWNVPSSAKTKIVKLKVVLKDASGVTVGKAVSDAFVVE